MHSPPSSIGLFFSSPGRNTSNGPEEEVEDLIASAREVTTLNSGLATALDSNDKSTFLEVFSRQVQLIKSRSQAFEDAHVTVYDKVLLALTSNGNNLESPAAITWYCTEYLGVNPNTDVELNIQLVHQAVKLPLALSQGLLIQPTALCEIAKDMKGPPSLPSHNPTEVVNVINTNPSVSQANPPKSKDDPKFAHLLSVYNKAYSDYLALADAGKEGVLEAAKFLRDTAENAIHFLRYKYQDDQTLAELTKTYDMAKLVVLNLNGGKKRKFDPDAEDAGNHNKKGYLKRSVRKTFKGKPKPRGRGPSGIPYGYTRPVDSYYPA